MELVRYEAARRALLEASTIDEAKHIVDQAVALQAYYKQAKDTDMEQQLAEIKLRARRRVGEISRGLEKSKPGGAGGGSELPNGGKLAKTETLKQAGLSTSAANRFEKLAEIPEHEFESVIAESKEQGKPVTYADVEKKVKRASKDRDREQARQDNKTIISSSINPQDLMGVYSTIVIDPPWDWGDEGDKDQLGRARPDYSTLSFDELKKLPVGNLSETNAHCYLWITNRSLPKGFGLFNAWGFRYITAITWVKPHFGMGNYFRGQTEHLLFGVKGSAPIKRKDQGTVFHANRGLYGHSSKPTELYDLVESCSHGPYLEMFSRSDRQGWTHWGEHSIAA